MSLSMAGGEFPVHSEKTRQTRTHSSRLHIASFSGRLSCTHASPNAYSLHTMHTPPPTLHAHCHACPMHTPPTHATCHAHMPPMHAPCHTHPSPCMPPAMHAPLPCIPLCHVCTPSMHAPLPCNPSSLPRTPPPCGQTDTCKNITFQQLLLQV